MRFGPERIAGFEKVGPKDRADRRCGEESTHRSSAVSRSDLICCRVARWQHPGLPGSDEKTSNKQRDQARG